MKSMVIPFVMGAGMILGICYLKKNKAKFDEALKQMKEAGNKITEPFKVDNCGC